MIDRVFIYRAIEGCRSLSWENTGSAASPDIPAHSFENMG